MPFCSLSGFRYRYEHSGTCTDYFVQLGGVVKPVDTALPSEHSWIQLVNEGTTFQLSRSKGSGSTGVGVRRKPIERKTCFHLTLTGATTLYLVPCRAGCLPLGVDSCTSTEDEYSYAGSLRKLCRKAVAGVAV